MGERINNLKSSLQENIAAKHSFEKVKTHFTANKKTYTLCATSFVSGAALVYLLKTSNGATHTVTGNGNVSIFADNSCVHLVLPKE